MWGLGCVSVFVYIRWEPASERFVFPSLGEGSIELGSFNSIVITIMKVLLPVAAGLSLVAGHGYVTLPCSSGLFSQHVKY